MEEYYKHTLCKDTSVIKVMKHLSLIVKRIVNQPIDSNCYLIFDKNKSDSCIIVDPGSLRIDNIEKAIRELSLVPEYIILTHEHYDHCWSVNELRNKNQGIKLICSRVCKEAIKDERLNYSHYFCHPSFSIEDVDLLMDELNWELGWNRFRICFEPARGHSDSGALFRIGQCIFTGDTLIKDMVTVTKFKTGSKMELQKTLQRIEQKKGNEYLIYSGHGDVFSLDDYDLSKAM